MSNAKTKVLLVDDSGFMRMVISDIVNAETDIEVIETAIDGKDAVEKNIQYEPDVILLDITMKDYDGLYAINHIMESRPVPIVILSSIRSSDPGVMVQALEAGAYDFLDKPTGIISSKIREINTQICGKIREAAKADIKMIKAGGRKNHLEHTFEQINYDIVAIGASTGGTGAIEHILMNLPSNLPIPVVIGQHMPTEFISSFAKRLDEIVPAKVKVAEKNEYALPNIVYILPGNTNTFLDKKPSEKYPRFEFTDKQYTEFNNPSIDCMMESVAEIYGKRSIGVILTGMGKDGMVGLDKMHKNGGYTIAQNEASCVVWGMPKAAWEKGAASRLISLNEIPSFIVSCIS